MRMSCGCEFVVEVVEDDPAPRTVISPCGLGHYGAILRGVSQLVEALEDVDIETGRSRA